MSKNNKTKTEAPETLEIRLAVPADALGMAEVLASSWEAAYRDIIPADYIREKNASRPEQFKRLMERNEYAYAVLLGDRIIGIMSAAPPHDEDLGEHVYELHYIYLHPEYWRLGIGTRMMEFAFGLACERGKTEMSLWVFSENANSISFYERNGFAPDGKTGTRDYGRVVETMRMIRKL